MVSNPRSLLNLREPYEAGDDSEETTEEEDATPEEKVDDAALNKLIETLLSEDYRALLKEKLAAKGLKLSTIDSSIYGKMEEPDEISGITTEAAYPLPKTLTLVDPATGNEQLYYASASFISQESDVPQEPAGPLALDRDSMTIPAGESVRLELDTPPETLAFTPYAGDL